MAISLNKKDFGNLIDPFNGLNDLKKGIIRTPLNPNTTYSENIVQTFISSLDTDNQKKILKKICEKISPNNNNFFNRMKNFFTYFT